MRLTSYGHSCYRLEVPGARLLVDPYLTDNPHGRVALADVPCDYVLCSHAHLDHSSDAAALARLHGATIVAPYELAEHFAAQGLATIDLMPGGGVDLPWGRIQMTPAIHSSSIELDGGKNLPMGVASGFIVRAAGRSIYHAGDTALFSDMSLIGRGGLDIALIPIGDFYTMGPTDALAALDLLRPKIAVPIHYNTSDKIRQDPQAFATRAAALGHQVRILAAGDSLDL